MLQQQKLGKLNWLQLRADQSELFSQGYDILQNQGMESAKIFLK